MTALLEILHSTTYLEHDLASGLQLEPEWEVGLMTRTIWVTWVTLLMG